MEEREKQLMKPERSKSSPKSAISNSQRNLKFPLSSNGEASSFPKKREINIPLGDKMCKSSNSSTKPIRQSDDLFSSRTSKYSTAVLSSSTGTKHRADRFSSFPKLKKHSDVLSSSLTSKERSDIVSSSFTSKQCSDVHSSSFTSKERIDVLSSSLTSKERSDNPSSSLTSKERSDIVSLSLTSKQCSDVHSSSFTSKERIDVLSSSLTSKERSDFPSSSLTSKERRDTPSSSLRSKKHSFSSSATSPPYSDGFISSLTSKYRNNGRNNLTEQNFHPTQPQWKDNNSAHQCPIRSSWEDIKTMQTQQFNEIDNDELDFEIGAFCVLPRRGDFSHSSQETSVSLQGTKEFLRKSRETNVQEGRDESRTLLSDTIRNLRELHDGNKYSEQLSRHQCTESFWNETKALEVESVEESETEVPEIQKMVPKRGNRTSSGNKYSNETFLGLQEKVKLEDTKYFLAHTDKIQSWTKNAEHSNDTFSAISSGISNEETQETKKLCVPKTRILYKNKNDLSSGHREVEDLSSDTLGKRLLGDVSNKLFFDEDLFQLINSKKGVSALNNKMYSDEDIKDHIHDEVKTNNMIAYGKQVTTNSSFDSLDMMKNLSEIAYKRFEVTLEERRGDVVENGTRCEEKLNDKKCLHSMSERDSVCCYIEKLLVEQNCHLRHLITDKSAQNADLWFGFMGDLLRTVHNISALNEAGKVIRSLRPRGKSDNVSEIQKES